MPKAVCERSTLPVERVDPKPCGLVGMVVPHRKDLAFIPARCLHGKGSVKKADISRIKPSLFSSWPCHVSPGTRSNLEQPGATSPTVGRPLLPHQQAQRQGQQGKPGQRQAHLHYKRALEPLEPLEPKPLRKESSGELGRACRSLVTGARTGNGRHRHMSDGST